MNPRLIKHLAMGMFLLITYAEMCNLPVVRIRTGRTRKNEQTEECYAPVKNLKYILA
jgi:hypothetical protein